jgi:hypothetical protein
MKRPLAALMTVLLMGALLWAGASRPAIERGAATPESLDRSVAAEQTSTPAHPAEGRVQALMESAGQGDVTAYLDAFAGPLRQRLDREVSQRGREKFADDLSVASKRRKSHAVFSAEPEGPDSARVVVEAVYPDRNERQSYRVEQQPGGAWLVTSVETVRSHEPKAKYGAPAAFLAPEGVPVQGSGVGVTVETGEEAEGSTGGILK